MEFRLNDYHHNISDEELLDDVKIVFSKLGKQTMSQDEYKQFGKFGLNTFRRRFGSWNNTLKLCGISLNINQISASKASHHHLKVTSSELIEDVQRVSNLLNSKTFTSTEYSQVGNYSLATYYSHFSNWNSVLQLAGLKPFDKVAGKYISDLELLLNIEQMWISFGRQPTSNDVKNGFSKYSLHAYARHFGSWRNALIAFVNWINEDSPTPPPAPTLATISKPNRSAQEYNIMLQAPPQTTHTTSRDINLRQRFKVLQRDHFKCCSCGASPATDPSVELHVDHIIPWAKGGESIIDNLQTLCSKCNIGKSDFL